MTLSKGGRARWNALALFFAISLAAAIPSVGRAFAQSQPPAPVIEAPSIFEIETSKMSPMSILIKPEDSAPQRGMLLIRGLPGAVTLTEGRLFASGVWSVKLTDLPNLKISAPASAQNSNITLSLVTLDGSVLDEKSATLSVSASPTKDTFSIDRGAAPAAEPPTIESASKPASTPPAQKSTEPIAALPLNTAPDPAAKRPVKTLKPLSLEENEKIQAFMRKGEENLRSGNINLARLFYKRSADAGWAPGAMALAGTYDTEELARMDVVGGIQPDAVLAKKWYEVARDLGSAAAQQKLQRLGLR